MVSASTLWFSASRPLALNCNPWNLVPPSLCENTAEAVPSAPHSCGHANSILPRTQVLHEYTPTSIHSTASTAFRSI